MKRGSGSILMAYIIVLNLIGFLSFPLLDSKQHPSLLSDSGIGEYSVADESSPISIRSDSELMAKAKTERWPGTGTIDAPYLIENLTIRSDVTCIRIQHTSLYFRLGHSRLLSKSESNGVGLYFHNVTNAVVKNMTIANKRIGMVIQSSNNCVFLKNSVKSISDAGIKISDSSYMKVLQNTAKRAYIGYELSQLRYSILNKNNATLISSNAIDFYDGTDCVLHANTINAVQGSGLIIRQSDNLSISLNTAYLSEQDGFVLQGLHSCSFTNNTSVLNGANGFFFDDCDRCTIYGNIAVQNVRNGISAPRLQNDSIIHNLLCANGGFGLQSGYARFPSVLSDNSLGWNRGGNAWENADENIWLGNKWSDYDGSREYSISGWANANDTNPSLLVDTLSPMIYQPEELVEVKDNESIVIQWHIWDCQPSRYEIYLNGTEIEAGDWNRPDIHIWLGPFEEGTYIIMFQVFDENGHSATNTVLVYVSARYNVSMNSFFLRLAIGLVLISSFSIVYCYFRKRDV